MMTSPTSTSTRQSSKRVPRLLVLDCRRGAAGVSGRATGIVARVLDCADSAVGGPRPIAGGSTFPGFRVLTQSRRVSWRLRAATAPATASCLEATSSDPRGRGSAARPAPSSRVAGAALPGASHRHTRRRAWSSAVCLPASDIAPSATMAIAEAFGRQGAQRPGRWVGHLANDPTPPLGAERWRMRTIIPMQRATATRSGRRRSVALRVTEAPAPGQQPGRGFPEPWPVAALEQPGREAASPR